MHNGNVEWKVLTRHINQQLEGKRWTQEREKGMSRGQMWRRWALMNVRENRPLLVPFIAHMLFIHLFFTPTPLLCYRLTLSHSTHPPLALHPFWTDGVFSNPTFYPIISLAGLRGWCSQYLSPPLVGLHVIKGAHLRAWRRLLLLWTLPDRSHVEIHFQVWTSVDSKTKTLLQYVFECATC